MPGYQTDHDSEQLRILITRFLHEADKGMPLAEFLGQVTAILLGSAGGGAVVVRVDDWIQHLRCRAVRSSFTSFRFETESDAVDRDAGAGSDSPQARICRALLRGAYDRTQSCFTRRGSFGRGTRDAALLSNSARRGRSRCNPGPRQATSAP